MASQSHKLVSVKRRTSRVRAKVFGTAERPRLNIHISNLHIAAQIIDDISGKTLAAATTVGSKQVGNMTAKATWVGQQIAANAKKAKVSKVVMDRGPRLYHGRIKALADAAREAGLEF